MPHSRSLSFSQDAGQFNDVAGRLSSLATIHSWRRWYRWQLSTRACQHRNQSLSAKSLYKHLLESLNFADGDDGLVEELAPSQLDLALATTDDTGFDAHLAEALGEEEMSDHCSSSSEEDDNNEAIS